MDKGHTLCHRGMAHMEAMLQVFMMMNMNDLSMTCVICADRQFLHPRKFGPCLHTPDFHPPNRIGRSSSSQLVRLL